MSKVMELEAKKRNKLVMTSINSRLSRGLETKITALVVDDDNTNRTIHHRLLENLGIENQVARNGKEAIDIHCSGENFDLILMDMDMPVMNGIEVCLLINIGFIIYTYI